MPSIARRPGLATFAAVMLFLVGAWSLLGGVCGGGVALLMAGMPEPDAAKGPGKPAPPRPGDPFAPARFIAKEVPSYYPVAIASVVLTFLIGIGEIACGVGVLRLSSTARTMTFLVEGGKLLQSFAINIHAILVVMPVQQRFMRENPQGPPGIAEMTEVITYISLGIAVFIQLAIASTIMGVLCAPKALRAAFADASKPPSADDPPRRRDEYDDGYIPPSGSPPETGIKDRSPDTGMTDRS